MPLQEAPDQALRRFLQAKRIRVRFDHGVEQLAKAPGFTMITSPGPASTAPRPLQERCPPKAITPIPNWSWEWRG